MDLLDYGTELFKVLGRRRLVQEMDLLKVLVDALLGVLGSARRHADFVMGSRSQGRVGEISVNTRGIYPRSETERWSC